MTHWSKRLLFLVLTVLTGLSWMVLGWWLLAVKPSGGISAVLAVKGDVQVGVDLAAGQWQQVDEQSRTAVLRLPEPKASRPRLDHDRSQLFAVKQEGLWLITPGDRMYGLVTDRAWVEAQKTVANAATDPQIIEKARRHAERVLLSHFAALGWHVQIRWPGRP